MRMIQIAPVIVIASFLISLYAYSILPDRIVTHWDIQGAPDGYTSKMAGLIMLPIVSLIALVILFYIPRIDPLNKNVSKFRNYYDGFIVLLTGFLLYVQAIVIFWNIGNEFNMAQALSPAFAVLFYYMSVILQHSKRNWFIGIRTPWTMSSDVVWDKTHKLGGDLMKICAVGSLIATFLPAYAMLLIVGAAVFFAAVTIVYSYMEFRKLKKR